MDTAVWCHKPCWVPGMGVGSCWDKPGNWSWIAWFQKDLGIEYGLREVLAKDHIGGVLFRV